MFKQLFRGFLAVALCGFLLWGGLTGCGQTPTCEYNGKTYKVGDSFASSDGCNTCSCMASGAAACTKKACVNSCGGADNKACGTSEFCNYKEACGAGSATGMCVKKPTSCTGQEEPVCGCDGKTYSNRCVAQSKGVSVQSKGACESKPVCKVGDIEYGEGGKVPTEEKCKRCSCENGKVVCKDIPCQKEDCKKGDKTIPHGASLDAGDGCNTCRCEDGKLSCTEKVCGCSYNGKTYKEGDSFASKDGCNQCTCKAGKVSCTDKACPPKKCRGGGDCDRSQYCQKTTCGAAEGVCKTRPTDCTKASPGEVCGCDMIVYANACLAAKRGISLKNKGKCKVVETQCSSNKDCKTGSLCVRAMGSACQKQGVCKVVAPCTKIYKPVCGCDGKTYANECLAQRADVPVRSTGACVTKGQCKSRQDCQKGYYCKKQDFLCNSIGVCSVIPRCNALEKKPVCGCDGKDYANPCRALLAGTTLKNMGACKTTTKDCTYDGKAVKNGSTVVAKDGCNTCTCNNGVMGCTKRGCTKLCKSDSECKSSEFCMRVKGFCASEGNCRPVPQTCTGNVAPVCGCDGKTYSNDCVASSKRVSVSKDGQCAPSGGCSKNSDCKASEFCAKATGQCGSKGSCKTKPTGCPKIYAPVCGCDGKTYSNTCVANSNGQNAKSKGACSVTSGCKSNKECKSTEYCKKPVGQCSASGKCTVRPGPLCPRIYKPVCGCDGKTYSNDCVAGAAGASLQANGKCSP